MTSSESTAHHEEVLPEVLNFSHQELDFYARVHALPPYVLRPTDKQHHFLHSVAHETDMYLRSLAADHHFEFIKVGLDLTESNTAIAGTSEMVKEFLHNPTHYGIAVLFGGYNILEHIPSSERGNISQIIVSRSHGDKLHGVHVYGLIPKEKIRRAKLVLIIEDMSDRGPAIAKTMEVILQAKQADHEDQTRISQITEELDQAHLLQPRKQKLCDELVLLAKKYGIVTAFPFSKNQELLNSLSFHAQQDTLPWSQEQKKLLGFVKSFLPTQWIEGRWVDTSYSIQAIISKCLELFPDMKNNRGAIHDFFEGIPLEKTVVRVGATSPSVLFLSGEHAGGYQLVAVAKIWTEALRRLYNNTH